MPKRYTRKWRPALVIVVIVVCQVLMVAAVQGTETGRELFQTVLSNFTRQPQDAEQSGQSRTEELFRGFPEKNMVPAGAPAGTAAEPLKNITSSYPISQLRTFENLKNLYLFDSDYIVPSADLFDLDTFLSWDLKADLETEGPQILIFHTHGSEYYADSGPGGVIQVGEYLKEVLEPNTAFRYCTIQLYTMKGDWTAHTTGWPREYSQSWMLTLPFRLRLISIGTVSVETGGLLPRLTGRIPLKS